MTIQQQADAIIHRAIRQTPAMLQHAISASDTERFERMREANRELYDVIRLILDAPDNPGKMVFTTARALIARIDGDTK